MTNGAPHPYEPPPRNPRDATPGGDTDGTARRRSRVRTLFPLGVAAWAVLEIWLLTVVAEAAGGLAVVLLLAAGLVLGVFAVRRAGRRAWQELSSTLSTSPGEGAAAKAASGGRGGGNTLAMLGGLLLIVPGLLSDVAGLLFLFPPTAGLLRRGAEKRLARGAFGEAFSGARSAQEQVRIHRPDGGRIVPGEVVREHRDDEGPSGR